MNTASWWQSWLNRMRASLGGKARRRPFVRTRLQVEILEDRLAPATVQFGLASESLLESAGTFTIPVILSTASATATTVTFSLGGNAGGTDFNGAASPLVIPAGQTAGNITGTLLNDGAPDATKTLTLTLNTTSAPYVLGATKVNTMTITEASANPTTLSIANQSTIEPAPGGTTNMVFTVTRTGDLTSQLTVGFTTVAGTAQPSTDFTPTTGTTTFAAGSATATISIPIFGNGVFNNPSLTFSVQLTGVTNVVGPPVTFANQATFATARNSYSLAVGDVNGDGKPDIVVAERGAGVLAVLLNTTPAGATTPSFASQQTFATAIGPFFVALGDVNGDGKPDILFTNYGEPGTVSVLLNTTAPGATTVSFATEQTFATGRDPNSVALGDVNGDGKPDLVVTNDRDSTVSVLLNLTPSGATVALFAPQQIFATGTFPRSAVLGDVNGDGKLDILLANAGNTTVSVLLNTTAPGAATASFAAQQTFAAGTTPSSVALGDINGDGKPDLVVTNANNFTAGTVSVLLNTTTPGATSASFAAQQTFAAGASPWVVALGGRQRRRQARPRRRQLVRQHGVGAAEHDDAGSHDGVLRHPANLRHGGFASLRGVGGR
jgi:FG-GAP-like repeat/Calx-beta domain/FG-GAP repeat